jgi:NAD(P)-dependent dehydrogenase (short-subunit alcohol dehydrogenase family)
MPTMTTMEGLTALVTGASRGIGAEIAKRFAADGAHVYVTARTIDEGDHVFSGSITTTVNEIRDAGGSAEAVAADLSKADSRARVVAATGPIDILVNNAAITYFETVADFSETHYRLMFEVQVRAPFELAQAYLPDMRARHRGWILNISSAAAIHPQGPPFVRGLTGGTVYGMCKAALERFTTGLASEVVNDGIAVNALSPSGLVLTPGVVHHKLDQYLPPESQEPVSYMAEAAHALCTGDPSVLTGKVTYAKPLLDELAIPLPS